MKKYFFLLALLPLFTLAQKSKTTVKTKTTATKKETAQAAPVQPSGGYTITGNIKGYPDGTTVSLLNANNGVPEATGQVMKDKFTLAGKQEFPDFKLIMFDNKQPYITLFLDNSAVTINANMGNLEAAEIKGSASHEEFMVFNKMMQPYQQLFTQQGSTDVDAKNEASKLLIAFIKKYPNSYVSPLAVVRNYQANLDGTMMDQLFTGLSPAVQNGPIGKYVQQQLEIINRNPLGKPLPDFSQADPDGKMISLSSFKGKYVLIDFWASWCGPCRQENPNVVATYNKYKDKNYTVLGVSFDKAKQPWLDAIKTDNLTWTHVSDLQGWANAVGQKFQIGQIPQNFLIDPNGILIAKNLRGPALESKLASLLGN